MVRPTTWSIFSSDGTYLGQQTAFAPEVAFAEYMMLLGTKVPFSKLEYRPISSDLEQISYGPNEYVLAKMPAIEQF